MPRFIAIPVGQGDAFFLERNDCSVLVDGGRSRHGFSEMFRIATDSDGVNVVVCTHNDADHANGILGFLEAGLRCEELWLPGRWLSTLPGVLAPLGEVVVELLNDVAQSKMGNDVDKRPVDDSPLEAYDTQMRDQLRRAGNERDARLKVDESGWPSSCSDKLEHAEPWDEGLWPIEDSPVFPYVYNRRLDSGAVLLLTSAIDAADRIRSIAIAAFHRGIRVRWFEFDTDAPSGGSSALRPVNAREITIGPPPVPSMLWALALTTSNKESLVFWSPPAAKHPGVLFTADSDLAGALLPHGLRRMLVTAPHHGSEANTNAYAELKAAAQESYNSVTWVRSDGKFRNRPGATYLAVPSRRFCTLCRGTATTKQPVRFFSRRAIWTRHPETAGCSCQ